MKLINNERINDARVKLTIEVSKEEFDSALDKAFEKVVKEVKVDGFRPGKMPKAMFIKRFGVEVLYEEAVNFALNDTYGKALMESQANPISDPSVSNLSEVKEGQGFTYEVEFDVMPEVKDLEYKGLVVKKEAVKVTAKMVTERINHTLEQKAENVLKEGKVENGDITIIDFEGFKDGVAFPGGKAENYELTIGSHSFIPGFEESMVGMVAGETREINVTFPENYQEKSLAGAPVIFKVTVHEIKTKQLPELNDEFVSELEIENVKTVDEYKEHVKEEIKKQLTAQVESKYENDIVKALIAKTNVEVPQSVVDHEVEHGVKNVEAQAKQYGIPVEVLLQYQGIKDMEAYKEMYKNYITDDIKRELCFAYIVKEEKLEAKPKEVEAKYLEIANVKPEATEEEVKKAVEQVKRQYPLYSVIAQINNEKAFNFVKKNVAKETK